MTDNHYKLIKLNIEMFEMFPYDFDVSELELNQFELPALIEGWEAYINEADFDELRNDEMNNDELDLLNRVIKVLLDIKEDEEGLDQIYFDRPGNVM